MKLARFIFGLGIGAITAAAGPITYAIDFTTASGIAPTSGAFTYDSSSPVGSQFSNFTVVWDTFTFDMTAQANSPVEYGTGCTASATSVTFFDLLSGAAQCTPSNGREWYAEVIQIAGEFSLCEEVDPTMCNSATGYIRDERILVNGRTDNWTNASGSLSITAVPEPSTFLLTLWCCLGLAGAMRVRGKRRAT